MKFKVFSVLMVGMLVSAGLFTGIVAGQGDADIHFDVTADPVIAHGPMGEWDGFFTDPGASIYHDGKFHMLRNGFQGWPASVEIGYLTSDDGLNWTEVSETPVFMTADAPFEAVAVLASSLVVENDGTWVLYAYVLLDGTTFNFSIARATAPAPEGPWTFDADFVLVPGSAGEWDSSAVYVPSVVRSVNGYTMYYTGRQADSYAIGMATSLDGVTWTKYDDPATADAPNAESDPVFIPTGVLQDWDWFAVEQPRVQLTSDGYVLLYRSFTGQQRNIAFGLARSDDGINWERLSQSPVFSQEDTRRSRPIWFSDLLYHDGTYFGFFEVQDGQGGTNIHVGTFTGSLR